MAIRVKGKEHMRRNEYYDWKVGEIKRRVAEGQTTKEMAKYFGMTEDDMFAFLSRNFGGITKLREELKQTTTKDTVADTIADAAKGAVDRVIEDAKPKNKVQKGTAKQKSQAVPLIEVKEEEASFVSELINLVRKYNKSKVDAKALEKQLRKQIAEEVVKK